MRVGVMRGIAAAVLVLTLACAGGGVLSEHPLMPGASSHVTWDAGGGERELWLDVRTTGGRKLEGPVEVIVDGKKVAGGTFSLEAQRILESQGHSVRRWVTTPKGAHGLVHLFDLPAIAAGSKVSVSIALEPGDGVTVETLALQVRGR